MKVKVEIFAVPNCNRCGKGKVLLAQLVADLGNDKFEWREVDVVAELDYAVKLGVLATPAIAINGQLVFSYLPSLKTLREKLLSM